MFNPCGEFQWSPECPVSQIHSPGLHGGAHGIYSDLYKVCSDAKERQWGAESKGKLPHLFNPSKLQTWFLSLQWNTCLWAELQLWCLSLQWKTCPWAKHSDDDDDDDLMLIVVWFYDYFNILNQQRRFLHWVWRKVQQMYATNQTTLSQTIQSSLINNVH